MQRSSKGIAVRVSGYRSSRVCSSVRSSSSSSSSSSNSSSSGSGNDNGGSSGILCKISR